MQPLFQPARDEFKASGGNVLFKGDIHGELRDGPVGIKQLRSPDSTCAGCIGTKNGETQTCQSNLDCMSVFEGGGASPINFRDSV